MDEETTWLIDRFGRVVDGDDDLRVTDAVHPGCWDRGAPCELDP